jgi:hypothetical protein
MERQKFTSVTESTMRCRRLHTGTACTTGNCVMSLALRAATVRLGLLRALFDVQRDVSAAVEKACCLVSIRPHVCFTICLCRTTRLEGTRLHGSQPA